MSKNGNIIVRYPPSPTGLLHIGNARTFLYNYLFATKNGGKIIFRIEDTDKERSKQEFEEDIIENLKWLKIEPDFSTLIRQSERGEIYKKYIEELIKNGSAYFSKESPVEENKRTEVIRFKNPNKKIRFVDEIRGEIEFDTSELGDFVIAKSLSEPIYHLAVVIDDFLMDINYIIRGEDGISNTPRQILIQEAIGAKRPNYAHLPLILSTDKTKLSKRKHGEKVSVSYYRKLGYIPEALINYLALVGWNPENDKDIFSILELINLFDIKKIQKKGGVFDIEKLNWINRQYLLDLSVEDKRRNFLYYLKKTKFKESKKLNDEVFLNNFLNLILERINYWGEIEKNAEEGEYDYFFDTPMIDSEKIRWNKSNNDTAKKHLKKVLEYVDQIAEKERLIEMIKNYAEKEGKGDVLWPLRYSLSGREKSPDPFTLIQILEFEEIKERISNSIDMISLD